MARYDHLPIYREAFDLALYFEKLVRGMGRYDKYTLGADLRNLSREVLRLIVRANSEAEAPDPVAGASPCGRAAFLRVLRGTVEELKVVLRLARESGAIGRASSYEFAAGKVVMIARQNEGWLTATENRGRPESRTRRSSSETRGRE